jgi:hypothetical protein
MHNIEYDYYSKRKYYVFNNWQEDRKTFKHEVLKLAQNLDNIATIGDDLSILAKNGGLIIIRDANAQEVREALGINLESKFRLYLKTAEYHTYIELEDKETNKKLFVSLNPDVRNVMSGNAYIRNDAYYDFKYYRGFVKYNPSNRHNDIDRASNYVAFDLTTQQAESLVKILNQSNDDLLKDKTYYNAFSWPNLFMSNDHDYFDDGQNCIDYIDSITKQLGLGDTTFGSYYRFDELNLKDRGMVYIYTMTNGYLSTLLTNFPLIFNLFFSTIHKLPFEQYFAYLIPEVTSDDLNTVQLNASYNRINELVNLENNPELDFLINEQNVYGDTALHIATRYQKLEAISWLLSHNASTSLRDYDEKIALSYAARVEWNADNIYILDEFIERTTAEDINTFDSKKFSNVLFDTVATDNLTMLEALLKANKVTIDIDNRNSNYDNIAHYAAYMKAMKVLTFLKDNHLEIMLSTNGGNQVPICSLEDYCTNPESEFYQYALTDEEYMHRYQNIDFNEYFYS